VKQYTYQAPFVATWKVDLWGKLRNAALAAKCDSEAKNEVLRYIKLGVSADVAATYYQIRTLDMQLEIYDKTKEVRKSAVEVTTARYEAGITNYADVSRAIVQYENVISEIIEATRERASLENRLGVLIGRNPSEFLFAKGELVDLPTVNPISPCSMIRRRPDIARAERALAARFMDIGVAKADLYPDLTVSGTLGYFSPDFPEMFKWRTRLWNFALQVSQSLFDAGKRTDRVMQAESVYYQTVFEFERAVILAFKEVEDALFAIKQRDAQGEALDKSIEASEITFDLLTTRYIDGLISYLEVVDAERTLLDSERIRSQVRFFQYFSRIQLMQALGGYVDVE
jgi:multidrug efflux system outer membrane protein